MEPSNDRAANWVQMWLDVSSEDETNRSHPMPAGRHKPHSEPPETEDFENNGLVIMQRKLMKLYEKLPPEEQEKMRSRTPALPPRAKDPQASNLQ